MNPSSKFYYKPEIDVKSIVIINRKSKAEVICPHCKNKRLARVDYYKKSIMGLCMPCAKSLSTRHGFFEHPIYHAWEHMKTRCYNKNFKQFFDYGGRGIKVCDEWINNPDSFIKWSLLCGWEEGLTIDRINNNGNYEPSNCRWTNRFIQMENTRDIKSTNTSGYRGVSFCKRSNSWRAYYTKENIRLFDKNGFKTPMEAKNYREEKLKYIKSVGM